MKSIFKNSLTRSIRNGLRNWMLQRQNPGLILGYNVDISNSSFGQYNFVGDNTDIRNTKLDDFSYVNRDARIGIANIGKFCSIGPGVSIGMGIHPTNFVSTHPIFYSTTFPTLNRFTETAVMEERKVVTIGHDVWIGASALILDGVSISNGAVIAAGAVVHRDVEPYEIVGGVPAKHIKLRFSSDDIEFLEKSAWWDCDIDWLKQHHKSLHSISEFKKLVGSTSGSVR